MKGYLALLIMVVGTSVSGALFADWLQDLSRQAEENLRLQGQRAIGGVPPAPPPQGGGSGGGQGTGAWHGGSGYGAGSGGAPRIQDWKVICRTEGLTSQTRNNGLIHTGERLPPIGKYTLMRGGFPSDAAARNWIGQYCPSWRCDWDGRCVAQGTPYGIDPPPRGGLFGQ